MWRKFRYRKIRGHSLAKTSYKLVLAIGDTHGEVQRLDL